MVGGLGGVGGERSNQMTEDEPYAPHETRMLSLQMAVEFVNGDARKSRLSGKLRK